MVICEVCNKKFANKANLKRHQETHEEKKVCPHCSATFSFKEGLKRHIKTQHEQPVGSIPLADVLVTTSKSVTVEAAYDNSLSTSSNQTISFDSSTPPSELTGPSPRKEKSHICIICKKGYTSRGGLVKHIESTHPDKASELIKVETQPPIVKSPAPPKKVKTFVNPQQLSTHDQEIKIGDRILTPAGKPGTLMYKGDVDFASGIWAGVELDTPTGKNDGSTKHKRYFQCRPNHGLFIVFKKLTKLQVSSVSQGKTDSKNLHEHFSNPAITAQRDHVDAIGLTLKPSTSESAQPSGVSGYLTEKRPSPAKRRSAPLRCNHCEGCERNQRGEDCRDCRYCKDKKKYGGPDTLRKPCEKRRCITQTRPSVKDGEFGSQPKRALSGTESGNQSTGQELNIKKRRTSVDLDGVDKLTLKLQREQAEKNRKKAENEKKRLEKNLINAKASASQLRSERAEKEKENAKLREQITHLQKELQKLKEMERETNRNSQVEKQNLERKVKSLVDENTLINQQMKYSRDENTCVNQQLTRVQDENKRIKRELTELQTEKVKVETELKSVKHEMEQQLDQMKASMLKELQSVRDENEKLLKDNTELRSMREVNQSPTIRYSTCGEVPRLASQSAAYSGPYCDICDVTDHETEDCPKQTFESLSPDGMAQIGYPVVSSIPDTVIAPVPKPLAQIGSLPLVYFDLETTGLERQSHITQIAAKNCAGHTFDRYVIPKKPISPGATTVTRNKIINGQFYHKDRPVLAISVSQALREFFYFIGDSPVILSGHNIKTYDCHVLLNAVKSCGMLRLFESKVAGFLDTLALFRSRMGPSYKQEKLYERIMPVGTPSYDAHNAMADVNALKELIDEINPSLEENRKHTFSVQYVLDVQEYNKNAAINMLGWQTLIDKNIISRHIAEKAAKSGLRLEHLEFSFENGGEDAIYSVFSALTTTGCRVTKNKDISKQLSEYCENKLLGLI